VLESTGFQTLTSKNILKGSKKELIHDGWTSGSQRPFPALMSLWSPQISKSNILNGQMSRTSCYCTRQCWQKSPPSCACVLDVAILFLDKIKFQILEMKVEMSSPGFQ